MLNLYDLISILLIDFNNHMYKLRYFKTLNIYNFLRELSIDIDSLFLFLFFKIDHSWTILICKL